MENLSGKPSSGKELHDWAKVILNWWKVARCSMQCSESAVMAKQSSSSKNWGAWGQEPWSSGYGRRLMFWRSCVQIPVPYTGWTWHFFTLICCKNCIVCLKRLKINETEAGVGPFKKRTICVCKYNTMLLIIKALYDCKMIRYSRTDFKFLVIMTLQS